MLATPEGAVAEQPAQALQQDKPSRSPDQSARADSGLVRGFDLPKTPAEFRKALGLPERPPRSPEATFREREQEVRAYAVQQTANSPDNKFRSTVTLKWQDSQIQKQLADQRLSTRLWRGFVKKRLKMSGLQHTDKLMQAVEEGVLITERRKIKPSVLVRLVKTLDPQDEVAAIEKFNLAVSRARQFYLVPDDEDFDYPDELIDFLATLAKVPEDTLQKIHGQFAGRKQVIQHPYAIRSGDGNPEHNGLLQIIKQGGLTPDQQETLNRAAVWRVCSDGGLPIAEKKEAAKLLKGLKQSLTYEDLINPEVGQHLAKYYPYLVDWATDRLPGVLAGKSKYELDKGTCGGDDLVVGLQHLDASGRLSDLGRLINAGWDCRKIYQMLEYVSSETSPANPYVKIGQLLEQALSFGFDPDKAAWASALSAYYDGLKKLFASELPRYEELVSNRETLTEIALILNTLPKKDSYLGRKEFLVFKDGKVGLDRNILGEYLHYLTRQEPVAGFDQTYIHGLALLIGKPESYDSPPDLLPAEDLQFYLYLAINQGRVMKELFPKEGNLAPSAEILNEFASQKVSVPDYLMGIFVSKCTNANALLPHLKYKFYDSISTYDRPKMLQEMPDEVLVSLPPAEQTMIRFWRSLPPHLQRVVAMANKEYLVERIGEGKPTKALLEYAIQAQCFPDVKQLITPELLATFSPEERQFWQACLGLPEEIVKLMSYTKQPAEWKQYFTDGKPTTVFLKMVVKSGKEEIDRFLSAADLSHLSLIEQSFWNFYKNIPQKPNMRAYLLKSPEKFAELVVNGQPTPAFLESAAADQNFWVISEVLPGIKVAELPPDQRAFWEYYPVVDGPRSGEMKSYLLQHRSEFDQLIEGGRPSLAFLNQAATLIDGRIDTTLIKQILDRIDWDKLPPDEYAFWTYYNHNDFLPAAFMIGNKSQFPQMVINEHETPIFYQLLASQEPRAMLEIASHKPGLTVKQYQDLWRAAIGKEAVDSFLAALPTTTDEARNAFTGNDYDRTSVFIRYLSDRLPMDEFELNAENFVLMTGYIRQFGLARNETIYKYYRWLTLFEQQKIAELPGEMKALGVTSTAEMVQRITEVRKMIFGERQLTNPAELSSLTPFQVQMLANVTGFDTARFGSHGMGVDMSPKINNFAQGLERGLIAPLPEGYSAESVEASSIKIEFNPDAVRKDYEILKQEILECIDRPPSLGQLKSVVKSVVERRIGKINDSLGKVTNEKAIVAITRDLNSYQGYLSQIESAQDIDSLTLSLLGMSFSGEDRGGGEGFVGIDSIMRRIILSKLYQRDDRSPGFLEDVRIKLSKDEVTAEGIDEIILTVDEMVKNHVLSLDKGDPEKYWRPEVLEAIKANDSLKKSFRRIIERFNPHAEKLRQEQTNFVRTQIGQVSQVSIIPDRGLIGEMSGYLADVCYIRVNDMLETYSGKDPRQPLVVPYKFVVNSPDSGDPQFIGSVLVFEVQTAKGEPALLVRALDIPNEREIDISKFTESLLDKFAEVAKKRGKKKVLVAGTQSTISNYSSIISHVVGKYVTGRDPEPVSPVFDFNTYDITNQIYTARIVE